MVFYRIVIDISSLYSQLFSHQETCVYCTFPLVVNQSMGPHYEFVFLTESKPSSAFVNSS